MSALNEQVRKVKAAIAGLEAQRSILGDAVVEPAVAALRLQLSELEFICVLDRWFCAISGQIVFWILGVLLVLSLFSRLWLTLKE